MASGWHKADIRAAVSKRGKTLTQIALDAGLAGAAARNALLRPSRGAEVAIAACIGVPLWELWPDRWRPDGSRIDYRVRQDNSCVRTHCARQKRRAA